MFRPATGTPARPSAPSTPTHARARASGDQTAAHSPRGGLEPQFSNLNLSGEPSPRFPGRFRGRQLPGQPDAVTASPSPSPTRQRVPTEILNLDAISSLFFEHVLPRMELAELIERVPALQERFPPQRERPIEVTVPDAKHQPAELDNVHGLALVFTLAQWAFETRNDDREDPQSPLVHEDYWTPTEPRKIVRDAILALAADLLRLCDRMTDTVSLLMVGVPEAVPASDGAPLGPDDVYVRTVKSRYIKKTQGSMATSVLIDMFKNLFAVKHAAYFNDRKRQNMTSKTFRELPARQISGLVEPWRYVAAPIVPLLLGVDTAPDLLQENLNRASAREQYVRTQGIPRFARVHTFFSANPSIDMDMRREIISMLSSRAESHHPAADWYYLFTTTCALPSVIAAGLLYAAVQDAAADGWPV